MADSSVSGPEPTVSVLKRRIPFEDRELAGLFELFDRLPPGDEQGTLSTIARDRLRTLFPRGVNQTGVVELVGGLNIEVDLGDLFGAEFYVGHCNESAVVSALCKTLPAGAKVVDVGANFGLYALHAARHSGKRGLTVAFEPAPRTFGLLEANIRRNRLGARIKARQAAVSETPGIATFHVATDESFSGLRDTGRSPVREAVQVEQVSLDTDPAVIGLGPIDFLKIDTEGGEAGVLAGARKTIERSPWLVVLMEYSFKNLTTQQAKDVRERVDELIAGDMRAWTLGLDGESAPLKSAASLPASFNGSLVLAAPQADWVNGFLAALSEFASPAMPDATLAWSAAESLVRIIRQRQKDFTVLDRLSSRLELPESEPLGERLKKYVEELEAAAKSFGARLQRAETQALKTEQIEAQSSKTAETLATRDQEVSQIRKSLARAEEDNAGLRDRLMLKQEEVAWYLTRLEQHRSERDGFRALIDQREADVGALQEKITSLRAFTNKLSDELLAKSEDVIQLMNRRQSDAVARSAIDAQWEASMDLMRTRMEALSSEVTRVRSEHQVAEGKRLSLRSHVDALNEKLKQVSHLRAVEAADAQRRLSERESDLETAEKKRIMLRAIIDELNGRVKQAALSREVEVGENLRKLELAEARIASLEKAVVDQEAAMVAQRGALASANARAEDLSRSKVVAEEAVLDLQRQTSEAAAALNERREQIRQLQQELALKKLGRRA